MKIIKTAAAVILSLIMIMNIVSADSTQQIIFEYEDREITVIFDDASFDDEQLCRKIADRLVYGDSDNNAKPMSLCWLFGHNITTSTTTKITHKVRTYQPRCLREVYRVQTCSKCDYYKEEMISATYIACHPND